MGGCSNWHLKLGEGQCEYPNFECVSLSFFCILANTRAIWRITKPIVREVEQLLAKPMSDVWSNSALKTSRSANWVEEHTGHIVIRIFLKWKRFWKDLNDDFLHYLHMYVYKLPHRSFLTFVIKQDIFWSKTTSAQLRRLRWRLRQRWMGEVRSHFFASNSYRQCV